jgi:hypothetical protein
MKLSTITQTNRLSYILNALSASDGIGYYQ